MEFKTLTYKEMEAYCIEKGEGAWLLSMLEKKVVFKVYPKVKGEDGKMKADKSQAPHEEERPITHIQLKKAFCEKFMPELLPQPKSAKPTMESRAKALREKLGL